ncbi:MAG TPA: hypothetical protein VK470_11585 [Bacteroidota bacterium]|nr:hypothetical protein [Bacteroidota bacterium]
MKYRLSKIFFLLIVGQSFLSAQGQVDPRINEYRNDPKGDYQYRRQGIMDGNQVRTMYYNNGEVAQWPYAPSLEWPKESGHQYLDGVCVLISAQITAPGNNQVIHPLETSYREEMPLDPVSGKIWGIEPVPGYMNPSSKVKTPAINKDTSTFPPSWPLALGVDSRWNGYWYGYFGRGVNNADFETFFVMDDSYDGKYKRPPYLYYPIKSDSGRGGLGLRVEVRGFQWSHVLAEDVVFWHYDIVNISDHNYDSTCFGFYSDPGVGGVGSGNDDASYSTALDLCYAWDHLGKGDPTYGVWKTGYYGYAYLESPGNPWNGIDDDGDGMVDERRDDNIDNNNNWVKFEDTNKNGVWDIGEPINDDLGHDGVGPFDPQYVNADEGEADGKPTHGEPNFDETDKDESDQIGLTAVSLTPLNDKGPNGVWPKNNEVIWRKMIGGFVDTGITNANISIVFSSGPFPLKMGRRERYSMALILGNDLEQVVFNKQTVQSIYNANYNFSKPPLTPHLTAVPGDKKVFLYWDAIAEESRNPFLKGKRDFEGYLVYRSQEAVFTDIKTITDSKGQPKYYKPLAQFDLIDSIKGPDPVGINGAHFWRGSNTGLQHSYIDNTVKNGVKYYYAVVSYNMGDPNYGTMGLQPTECTKIITEDVNGSVKFVDINCAIVTPNAAAAGYIPAAIDGNLDKVTAGIGTGSMAVEIANPNMIFSGTEYRVGFTTKGAFPQYTTKSFTVSRTRDGKVDTLLRNVPIDDATLGRSSSPFDGMTLTLTNPSIVDVDTSGWIIGTSNIQMLPSADSSMSALNVRWPADYEIKFSASVADTSADLDPTSFAVIPVNFTITNTTFGYKNKFLIKDNDGDNTLSSGDEIKILETSDNWATFSLPWKIQYFTPRFGTPRLPAAGDKFVIRTSKPFYSADNFTFKTKASTTDLPTTQNALAKIAVVPNPYIGAASWEPKSIYQSGRGERKIDFVHLPAKCTIRIYTVNGGLVKTLIKDSAPANGSLSWNLVTDDGTDVAYGLYIYHVDAGEAGTHIGKFALIK